MTNHAHDAGNLVRGINASKLALLAHRGGKSVFVCFIYRRLVKADRRGVDVHIRENNIWIGQAIWEL